MAQWSVEYTIDRPYGSFEVFADSKTEAAMKAAEWIATAGFGDLTVNLYDDQREDITIAVEDITPYE